MARSSAASDVNNYVVDNCTCINEEVRTDLYFMELLHGTETSTNIPKAKVDPIEVKLQNFE